MIYQELTLFGDLTVAENVFAGREPFRRVSRGLDFRRMRAECRGLFATLGVDLDPDARVGSLSLSEQQLVEVAKALSIDGRVIIMDEPTAALSRSETSRLLDVARGLRDAGRSVIYVSHHLDEVFEIADRVTVLRDGCGVATLDVATTTEDEFVRLMVGREIVSFGRREGDRRGPARRLARGRPAA